MEEQSESLQQRYRKHLRSTVGFSAAPYGYTLAIWTSGATLTHIRGVPDAFATFSFMAGAIAAFAFVGMLAFGGVTTQFEPRPDRISLWGSFHFLSVGMAIGTTLLIASYMQNALAWPISSFLSTSVYLLVVGAEFTLSSAE